MLLEATADSRQASEENRVEGDRGWFYLKPLLRNLKSELQTTSSDRHGCVISNSKFGLDYFDRHFSEVAADPFFRDEVMGHSLAQKSAQLLDLRGPCLSIASACATGVHNVIFAAQRILNGEADVMVCGAAEASKVPVIEAAFDSMGVLSKRGVCAPFDKERDGFVMGEGAACCLLRRDKTSNSTFIANCEMQIAKSGVPGGTIIWDESPDQREDTINSQCALRGWGMTNDSTHPIHFHSSGEAIAVAIQKSLHMARLNPSDIDLIYAHGTGTRLNDQIEVTALRTVFGSHLSAIPITSTKGLTGHLLGAAGAVELVLACEMLEGQYIIPTNCQNLDEEFRDLRIVTEDSGFRIQDSGLILDPGARRLTPQPCKLKTILKLNYGFGGQIAAIVLARA